MVNLNASHIHMALTQSLYMHTCIHTYIYTYLHACIHADARPRRWSNGESKWHTHTHGTHSVIIHVHMHTYIHTCMHVYMQILGQSLFDDGVMVNLNGTRITQQLAERGIYLPQGTLPERIDTR